MFRPDPRCRVVPVGSAAGTSPGGSDAIRRDPPPPGRSGGPRPPNREPESMHPDFPLDIAVRAARLDERLALAGLLRPADTPTDPLTAWRISRAADRLERPGLDR